MSRPFWRSNQHNHFKKLLFLHSLTVLSTLAFDDSNKVDPLFTIGCQIPRNIICFYKKNILKTSCNQETQHRILRGGCLPFSLHTLYICSKSCDKHSITIAASPDCRTSITCRVRRIECNQHPWIFTRGRSYLAMLLVVTPPRHRGIQNFAWSIPSLTQAIKTILPITRSALSWDKKPTSGIGCWNRDVQFVDPTPPVDRSKWYASLS